jgi:hypothetical protein
MSLRAAVRQLKREADQHPFDPLKWLETGGIDLRHRRDMTFREWDIRVQFTRTVIGACHIYQLSIGSQDPILRVQDIPEYIIQRIREAFFPNGSSATPSILGNSRQFMETVK